MITWNSKLKFEDISLRGISCTLITLIYKEKKIYNTLSNKVIKQWRSPKVLNLTNNTIVRKFSNHPVKPDVSNFRVALNVLLFQFQCHGMHWYKLHYTLTSRYQQHQTKHNMTSKSTWISESAFQTRLFEKYTHFSFSLSNSQLSIFVHDLKIRTLLFLCILCKIKGVLF